MSLRFVIRLPLFLMPLLLAGSAVATSSDKVDTALGRLFFTPERRAALERQRQLNIQETQAFEGASMSLDGVVVRSSGKRTVWINSRVQHDQAAPAGVTADLSARQPGRAVLRAGEESPTELKVGETINRATRETAGGLAGGQIGIHRPAAPAKK